MARKRKTAMIDFTIAIVVVRALCVSVSDHRIRPYCHLHSPSPFSLSNIRNDARTKKLEVILNVCRAFNTFHSVIHVFKEI